MRRYRAHPRVAVVSVVVLLHLLGLHAVGGFAVSGRATAQPAPVGAVNVLPRRVLACDTSDVASTHTLTRTPRAVDVILVVDGSWWPQPPRQALDAMESLIDRLLTDTAIVDARIGILLHMWGEGVDETGHHILIVQRLEASRHIVLASWRTVGPLIAGGEWYHDAIPEAHRQLRLGMSSRPDYTERIMILVGDGSENLTESKMRALVERPKLEGTRVMAICFYRHPLCTTYEATVSVPDDYVLARTRADYAAAVDTLTERILGPRIVAASVEHQLAPAVAAVPGSAVPAATYESGDGRVLRWDYRVPVPDSITTTYRIAPQVEVFNGTAVTTTLTITDDVGFGRVVDISTADVEIIGPCMPTPTLTPTATATPTLAPSPTPTRTPPATATPTPAIPPSIYIPLGLNERCDPAKQRIDVVLVLDASTSMAEPTRAGRLKIEAALVAARAFLDLLALGSDEGDQAAIVAFNSDAWILAPLTSDRAALDDALGKVVLGRETRLDRAVAIGAQALADDARRRPGNEPVLILLTDGRANPVPIDVAVAEAEAAHAAGITLFTIGLGDDIDAEGLAAMASRAGGFLRAPDAEDLVAVYAEVARSIPCPPSGWWAGR